MSVMRSSRRQRNLPPESSTAMENVEGRNSKSASDARTTASSRATSRARDWARVKGLGLALALALNSSHNYILSLLYRSPRILNKKIGIL